MWGIICTGQPTVAEEQQKTITSTTNRMHRYHSSQCLAKMKILTGGKSLNDIIHTGVGILQCTSVSDAKLPHSITL